MPELPEIQALAERIDVRLNGATLEQIQPIAFAALKTFAPSPDELVRKRLTAVGRRGKFLVLTFQPDLRMLIHFSQGGRIDMEEKVVTSRPKAGVVRLRFDRLPSLLVKEFGTERKAGWWVLSGDDPGPLAKLGPDPYSEEFAEFMLHGSDTGRLHPLLRDQRRVAGVGRGYTDDILHRARLSPFRSLSSLSDDDRARLLATIRGVLGEGLEEERRRRVGGLPAKVGDHWIVHKRSGTPCPVCGADLRRVSFESHEITYCPSCQTGGKILADRRMSRLLK